MFSFGMIEDKTHWVKKYAYKHKHFVVEKYIFSHDKSAFLIVPLYILRQMYRQHLIDLFGAIVLTLFTC